MFIGGSNAGQANVIDRAVWTCQWLGLLEVFANDIEQDVDKIPTFWSILHSNGIKKWLKRLVVARNGVRVAPKLLWHPVQLVGTDECLLAFDINAS